MLPKDEVIRAEKIQRDSYKLLLWLAEAIDRGSIPFSRAHNSVFDAFYDWIKEYYENLPKAIRPEPSQMREFSNYFGSYISTSFDLVAEPGTRIVSECGCYCVFCTHLENASHLQPKKVTIKDKQKARQKCAERLMLLADEENIPLSPDSASAIANAKEFRRSAAYSTYGHALLERIRGFDGGVYILALWREIAWKPEGSPIPDFVLKSQDIFNAEQTLTEEIKRRQHP
jgi:hypothetical protein